MIVFFLNLLLMSHGHYESCVTVQTFLVISKKHFNTENNQDTGNEPAALLNCSETEDAEAREQCPPVWGKCHLLFILGLLTNKELLHILQFSPLPFPPNPAHLPSSVFADCCLSFFTLFVPYRCIHLHPHYRALPVFHSDLQWEKMWGWSDIRQDHYPFPRSSLDPSSRPKFSHLHPRPLLLPFTLKCSSDSRCSDNCSGMTVFHPNPQTCCHGNWTLQIAPRHIQPPLTWNMNDEFEVLCACVCPWMCARGGQWTDFSS